MTNSNLMSLTANRQRGLGSQTKQAPIGNNPPTTVQIKSNKIISSKTTNHSPTDNKKIISFIQQHGSSGNVGSDNQNLALINQLQQNPQSMLHNATRKQNSKHVMQQHDSSSEMNVNDGTGAEYLTQEDDRYDTK